MVLVSEKVYQLLLTKIDGLKKEERVEKDADQRKTYDEVFDQITLMNIYKLITDKHLDTLDFPISTGKEANVFHGTTHEGKGVAVKIYRVATATYKNLRRYIEGDPRFRSSKGDHRSLVYTWARKEYKNLKRMRNGEVSVPVPVTYRNNILVMEFIGTGKVAAPMLKDVGIENPEECFEILIDAIKTLYQKCRMVHGDLSEYNVLIPDDDITIIDVGQSVLVEHPMAHELLVRDVSNIVRYFKKYGVKGNSSKILKELQSEETQNNGNNNAPSDITDELSSRGE
jgi:RIO kinase 1